MSGPRVARLDRLLDGPFGHEALGGRFPIPGDCAVGQRLGPGDRHRGIEPRRHHERASGVENEENGREAGDEADLRRVHARGGELGDPDESKNPCRQEDQLDDRPSPECEKWGTKRGSRPTEQIPGKSTGEEDQQRPGKRVRPGGQYQVGQADQCQQPGRRRLQERQLRQGTGIQNHLLACEAGWSAPAMLIASGSQ